MFHGRRRCNVKSFVYAGKNSAKQTMQTLHLSRKGNKLLRCNSDVVLLAPTFAVRLRSRKVGAASSHRRHTLAFIHNLPASSVKEISLFSELIRVAFLIDLNVMQLLDKCSVAAA